MSYRGGAPAKGIATRGSGRKALRSCESLSRFDGSPANQLP